MPERRSTRVKAKFEPPKIAVPRLLRRPEVAEADARWAATFGHGFESKADSDFVEWRDKVVLTEAKTVDGWVPVRRAIDGISSNDFMLAPFYGDTEDRRQFGVDDVVFNVLRQASWARPLAAAAEGRVRKCVGDNQRNEVGRVELKCHDVRNHSTSKLRNRSATARYPCALFSDMMGECKES